MVKLMLRKTCAARRSTYSALLSLVVLMEKERRFKTISLAITSPPHLPQDDFKDGRLIVSRFVNAHGL